jgi:TonB-linked SusC/RagA family outer membrane protein
VSYIGCVTQEIPLAGRTELTVTLVDDMQALEEVVVVGYGTQKKVNLSGAVNVITAKTLESRVVTNATNALQGLAPNLNITRSSGAASSKPAINIRGYTSINGGNAFILVDNVPTSSDEFARMNPSDIESVTVLKDASSAAIYGARAAFGVLLVTTRTAQSDRIRIDVDYAYGLRQFDNIPEVLTDIPEYMRMANIMSQTPDRFNDAAIAYAQRRMNDRSLPEILGPGRENGGVNDRLINRGEWEYYGIYNWFDVMLKDVSPSQTANVRISQRGERLAYSASGGWYREDGMMTYGNDRLMRFNFRGNATYEMSDRWQVGTNLAYNRENYESTLITGENDFWFYRLHSNYPTQPIYNPDGTYTQDGGVNVGSALSGGGAHNTIDESLLSFHTKFDFVKNVWSINADATFKYIGDNKDRVYIPVEYNNKPGNANKPHDNSVQVERNYRRMEIYNLYTNFNKTFEEKHSLTATLGYNQEYFIENNTYNAGTRLITASIPSLQLTLDNAQRSQSIGEYALRGLFGRLNYIFEGRYIFEVNGRYDGSSRFPKGHRFGFFPSFSGAWILSQERFMEHLNERFRLSNLKLRASYGSLGNQQVDYLGYYPAIATMGYISQIHPIIEGGRSSALGAPGATTGGLTWETVRTINGGIDLGLLDNRLNMAFDFYTRYTENMLTASRTLPAVFGTGAPRANAADLKTKGWEVTLGWRDDVQLAGSPLSYNVSFMLADSRAWITRFDNPEKNLGNYYEGQELGEMWGYTTLGYFASDAQADAWADQSAIGNGTNNYEFKAGDLKFEDVNRDGRITYGNNTVADPGDRRIIGNNRERFPYSIDAGADWKGFDLRLFFQGIGKRDAYARTPHNGIFFWGMYVTPWCNPNTKNLDHWTPENPDAFFPRLKPNIANNGEMAQWQTKYLQDASYLRLKTLTLGYTFPSKWINKANIGSLRLYFTSENLLTFHHIRVKGNDPEKFGSDIYYPFQRTFSFGLNLGF